MDVAAQDFLFQQCGHLYPKETTKFSQQPLAWDGWSSPRQSLFTQENLWICQAGGEKADFLLRKNIGQDDFLCASTPSGTVPMENIKTPFAGLFCKKKEKKIHVKRIERFCYKLRRKKKF